MDWDPWAGKPGIYAVQHYRVGWRYICSYRDGKQWKGAIFESLARAGQTEARGEWDLHHIVERQHAADIDFAGRLVVAYQDELPCVLIPKEEHRGYNQLLHIRETDEMFRDDLPVALLQRSRHVASEAKDPANHATLRERVRTLQGLYSSTYGGDFALQRIARNVFEEALGLLR